ncbi:MAG: ribonuclease II [Elusimicrobia bacterium RIFOXYB2_FULL_49_7]|nr:MAG: ribonuclease II [Elusimicrobia bacterium RIFOXYB2_FULL_49_7]
MTDIRDGQHRAFLQKIAKQVMANRGFLPEIPYQAIAELNRYLEKNPINGTAVRDLVHLPWCSIDNDASLDLDQLTVAEIVPGNKIKILVAVSDVALFVKRHSGIDDYAEHNTTSVYTGAKVFPMLPEKLSTDLSSLNYGADRYALITEMVFDEQGLLNSSDLYTARVNNHAKLAYAVVGAWLAGNGPLPQDIKAIGGLEENLHIQSRMAQQLKSLRHEQGALSLETLEANPVFEGNTLKTLEAVEKNRATEIIEEFMIAANSVAAQFLTLNKIPALRRIVRTPKRWERIVELAKERGHLLPDRPDAKALNEFLTQAKSADPSLFPDLSLSVIKLLGPGEYQVERPGSAVTGHFGLALSDYTHATAPNRRFPDLVTQRLIKAALAGENTPYTIEELLKLAKHCTDKADDAKKVERQLIKSAAAMLLENRIGEQFNAMVTGASGKGTWVRVAYPPVEGRLVSGYAGLDVGRRLRVQLVYTDVERGFIDFASMT